MYKPNQFVHIFHFFIITFGFSDIQRGIKTAIMLTFFHQTATMQSKSLKAHQGESCWSTILKMKSSYMKDAQNLYKTIKRLSGLCLCMCVCLSVCSLWMLKIQN